MILGFDPIDLPPLRGALEILADLDELSDRNAADPFTDPVTAPAIANAVWRFRTYVSDNAERETPVRRGLAYLLNLDDDRLLATTTGWPMRMRLDAALRRRFLEMLWDATFASWRVDDFVLDDYEVIAPT